MKCPYCGTEIGNNVKGQRKGLHGQGTPSHVILVYCFNDACSKVLGVMPAS